jgi:hypothetical protein
VIEMTDDDIETRRVFWRVICSITDKEERNERESEI